MGCVLGGQCCVKVIGQFLVVRQGPSLTSILHNAFCLWSNGGTLGMMITTSINIVKIIALLGDNVDILSHRAQPWALKAAFQPGFRVLLFGCSSRVFLHLIIVGRLQRLFSSLPSQISRVVCHTGGIRKVQDDLEAITCLWSKFCKRFSVQNCDWLEGKLMKSMRTGNRVLYEWKCWRTVITI